MSPETAIMVMAIAGIYLYYSSLPVWHSDVWGHLSYGRYLWETGSLPDTEPLLPVCKGVPFFDPQWLSQLIGFAVVSTPRLGVAGLQGLLGVCVALCATQIWSLTYGFTRSVLAATLSVLLFLFLEGTQLIVLRPQLAGLICFTSILTRTMRTEHKSDWVVIPMIFVLWANLHPSFFVGLGLLATVWFGRFCDVLFESGSLPRALRDPSVHRSLGLNLVSAVFVLMNPYGLGIYPEIIRFTANQNLQDLTEWQPLNIQDTQGLSFAAGVLLLMVSGRWRQHRMKTGEWIALVGLGFASLWSSRMIVWWAPVAALLAAQNTWAIWDSYRMRPIATHAPPARVWSCLGIGVACIVFFCSPPGLALVFHRQADSTRGLSKFTPVFSARYLRDHPPSGLVFSTYEWSDFLQWSGPKEMRLFLNSHAHLIPRDAWLDYMRIIEMRPGWNEAIDRYGFTTLVLDQAHRHALIEAIRHDDRWGSPPEESDGQVIFVRKRLVGTNSE
jgi:hypothetical protein